MTRNANIPPGEFVCPACGEPTSRLDSLHAAHLTRDSLGWPVFICTDGVQVIDYTTECWGGGGSDA